MADIYLAASYNRKDEMCAIAEKLQLLGHTITSRWIVQHGEDQETGAREDLEDIDNSAWVISFTGAGTTSGGRHVEFGYALAKGKAMVLIGEPENVFHKLKRYSNPVYVYPTLDAFLEAVAPRV